MPYIYFLVVMLLSVPFWLAGHAAGELPIPIDLPASALMAFVPGIVALVFVWRETGRTAATELLARSFDWKRVGHPGWFAAAALFMPATLVASYLAMRMTGAALPPPQFELLIVPVFFAMFFAAALGEEIGWQGYAFDRMKGTALSAALILGAVWTLWHVVPYFQTGRGLEWVAWHCGVTMLLRIVTVWLYVNGGRSVFIAALFHAMCNVAFFLYPVYGSHYDPVSTFAVLGIATAAIVWLWGPQTLARFRFSRR